MICFKEFGFHWTYWTYKAVKSGIFPDGLFSFIKNPPWVNRAGPLTGWDTYHLHWPQLKKDIVRSWRTDQFKINAPILKVLRTYPKISRRYFCASGPEAGPLPPAGDEDGRVPQGQDPQHIHSSNFGITSSHERLKRKQHNVQHQNHFQ